jgi:signal transduction histidine kinase
LPENIKTFFAFPLLSNRTADRQGGSLLRGNLGIAHERDQEPRVPGILVGAYYRPWKLRRAEIVLLHVLANQASTVLVNIHLMAEVLEARNEARKLLRQVLEDQRLKELILESIPSGLITTDRQGYITTFNRAATTILGYLPSEAIGQPLYTLLDYLSSHIAGKDTAIEAASTPSWPHDRALQTWCTGARQSGTITALDSNQREIMLDVDVLPLRDALGEQIGTLVTFADVTSVHRLEEEKRRLDRLATLGEMAANVAHEVRNPLASIKTSMQMLMEDLVGSEPASPIHATIYAAGQNEGAQESIAVVLKEVERLDTIVRELLLFARPHRLHRVKCHLPELSDHILQLIQAQCVEANVFIHRDYHKVPPIWIDVAQMEQVLLNLYINALQAMPDGGMLTVTCQVLSSEESNIQDRASPTPEENTSMLSVPNYQALHESSVQSWLKLSASDTGVGIPPDQLERIFQPFFTTKAHGIGLGLAITRRLVEDHGGYIQVEGRLGHGATLSIHLPLITEDKASPYDDES